MSACRLYHTWFPVIHKLLPAERITRLRNVTWMVVGMYLSGSAHLSSIASVLPMRVKLTSTTDRFRRLLDNKAFHVRRWYEPIARQLLAEAALSGPVRLIMDGSKIGSARQLLIIAVAYRKRALPIAWTWVRGSRGHSSVAKQLALLRAVQALMPAQAKALLVGDCEFGAVAIAHQLECWGWTYALRQQGDTRVCVSRLSMLWQQLITLATQRDQPIWYDHAIVTFRHLHHTHLLAYWKTGEKEPWLLMTNLPDARRTLKAYQRRMWIEEMFGDWKSHGVDLETTHLRRSSRLSRLIFLVALLYLWLITRGAQAIKAGHRRLVDRRERRDLSLFRIGLYILRRYCAREQDLAVRIVPFF